MAWFGGKSKIADSVWQRFGDVRNYVEPFFGSGAVLLGRPEGNTGTETVNDLDGFLSNAWRAIQHDPEQVAYYASWPVSECDLHARHLWLVSQRDDLTKKLMGDFEYYNTKIAGFWIWGICAWIGTGWCSGSGPWQSIDGIFTDMRKLPHLGTRGQGINRQLPHLGTRGQFINDLFSQLSNRLRDVRVCCGDWLRIMGPSPTIKLGCTGVFLDPPYADTANRCDKLYACDSLSVAHEVQKWCVENGDNPLFRIALCGYEGEHVMPATWEGLPWKASGGYSNQSRLGNDNCAKERIWFSPHCLKNNMPIPALKEA